MELREKCKYCGCSSGSITTKNGQDCVYCDNCGKWLYNAPKTETGREVRTLKTIHENINQKKRAEIIVRANGRCELCGSDEMIEVGHIISVEEGMVGGMTDSEINSNENLVAMCKRCNIGLGKNILPLKNAIFIVKNRIRNETTN